MVCHSVTDHITSLGLSFCSWYFEINYIQIWNWLYARVIVLDLVEWMYCFLKNTNLNTGRSSVLWYYFKKLCLSVVYEINSLPAILFIIKIDLVDFSGKWMYGFLISTDLNIEITVLEPIGTMIWRIDDRWLTDRWWIGDRSDRSFVV